MPASWRMPLSFSGLTRARRAHQGRILLAVMLDPGNPQVTPAEAPGALHLPVKRTGLPFALLHAKVAVLGFQSADRFVLRIIVSTGNWTRQTLEEVSTSPGTSTSSVRMRTITSLLGTVPIWPPPGISYPGSSNSSIFARSNAPQGKTTGRPMLRPSLPHMDWPDCQTPEGIPSPLLRQSGALPI